MFTAGIVNSDPHVETRTHQFSSVQFSRSVVSGSLRLHESSMPGLPVHYHLPEFTQTHVHRVRDAMQPSHYPRWARISFAEVRMLISITEGKDVAGMHLSGNFLSVRKDLGLTS